MKYWVYLNGEVPGSYEAEELAAIPGFGETSLVCPASEDLAERRWERAGAFADIADALRGQAKPPLPPAEPPPVRVAEPGRVVTPEEILNDSSQRLFRHVTELMKELENRREERALTQSLQRRVAELTNELSALRERATYLQGRADLIPGFQDRERELQEALARARADLHDARQGAERLDAELGKTHADLLAARRSVEQLKAEAAERDEHVAGLSRRLAEKEATLAKAFGVIRRLEESLGDLLPGVMAGIATDVPSRSSVALPEVKARPAPAPAPEQEPEPEPVSLSPEPPPALAPEPAVPEAEAAASPPPPERHPTPPPYTMDPAAPEPPTPLPSAEDVQPVPAPWKEKLSGLFSRLKARLSRGEPPPEA